jgi:hypothetical protein
MDDAVAESRQSPVAQLFAHPWDDHRQQFARHGSRLAAEVGRIDRLAVGPAGTCFGAYPDAVDLAGQEPLFALVKAEL